MKQILCITLVSLAFASGVFAAQSQTVQGTLHRSSAPMHGTYNMSTGFELGASSDRSGPATIFDNTNGINYYFSTMSYTQEWVDSMAFVADEISGFEQINGIDFSYCSQVPDPTGDLVSVEMRFYYDNPGGQIPTGWLNPAAGTIQNARCAYLLGGIPGDTSLSGQSCWTIEVDLMCGYECPLPQEQTPGGFTEFNGIGWMYYDPFLLNATGPFLGSTVTTAGPGTAIPGYGSKDEFEAINIGIVGGLYQGTFNFGGRPKGQATFDTILYGDGILDTTVIHATVPTWGNVMCLGSDVEFRTGSSVTWALNDLGGTAVFPSAAYALLIGTNGKKQGYGDTAGSNTTLLIDPASLLPLQSPMLMSGTVPSITVPPLPGLPSTIWVQAFGFNGGVGQGNAAEASNALRHDN